MKDILPPTWYVTVTHANDVFGRELRISMRDENTGQRSVAQRVVMTPVERGAYVAPTMVMDDDLAKRLMDALWQSGVRPSHDVTSTGQLGAMKEHIADLRRIAFAKSHQVKTEA